MSELRMDYLSRSELITLTLRELFDRRGYKTYKMSKFEPYDLYAQNRSFVSGGNILTFNDTNGRLMALKPDVTLSIVKNYRGGEQKVSYNESVYRDSGSFGEFCEITQTGIERIGSIDSAAELEVLELAAESLAAVDGDYILEIAHAGYICGLLKETEADEKTKENLLRLLRGKNSDGIKKLAESYGLSDKVAGIWLKLAELYDDGASAAQVLCALSLNDEMCKAANALSAILERIPNAKVDLSIVTDLDYYNGVVFKGYIPGVHSAVLSGGRYDSLVKKLGKNAGAIGFAVYMNVIDAAAPVFSGKTVRIALPKGRLGESVYNMLEAAGYGCPAIREKSRKLIFDAPEANVSYFWAKPSDVTSYVERGAADIGICGSDILAEYSPDVFELMDLGLGKCRMCVAAKNDFTDDNTRPLRVATKFPNIAKKYYSGLSREIDIIHLTGSIELAPIVGLSDVIVDIVETGSTLRENGLTPFETVTDISARLIANKAGYKFKYDEISAIVKGIGGVRE